MISPEVMQELLAVRQVLHYLPESQSTVKGWTPPEQQLFWVALSKYPQGPWTSIADYIGTKTTRQAMTHAQKLRQKLKRWNTRLRSNPAVSSLIDGVSVTADGEVSISTASTTPFGIPVTAPSATTSQHADRSAEHESKDHEQHGLYHTGTVNPANYSLVVPVSSNQADHQVDDHSIAAAAGAAPLHQSMPFLLGLHPHTQGSTKEHEASSAHDDLYPTIPHEFVDSLVRSLMEEEDQDDDEVTDEQLKELDDGDLADYR